MDMKKLLLLVGLLALITSSLSAQGWEKILDVEQRSSVKAVAADVAVGGGLFLSCVEYGSDGLARPLTFLFDAAGNIQWTERGAPGDSLLSRMSGVLATPDGGLIVVYKGGDDILSSQVKVRKLAANGQLDWSYELPNTAFFWPWRVIPTTAGRFLLIGNGTSTQVLGSFYELDSTGVSSAANFMTDPEDNIFFHDGYVEEDSGDIIILGHQGPLVGDGHDVFIARYSATGGFRWKNTFPAPGVQIATAIEPLGPGSALVALVSGDEDRDNPVGQLWRVDLSATPIFEATFAGHDYLGSIPTEFQVESFGSDFLVAGMKRRSTGDVDWSMAQLGADSTFSTPRLYGRSGFDLLQDLLVANDSCVYLVGTTQGLDGRRYPYIVKTDSLGNSFTNEIFGSILPDQDLDCALLNETGTLENWVVQATKDNFSWLASTDAAGQYTMRVDTGTYELTSYPRSDYWSICEDTIPVDLLQFYDSERVDFAAQALVECPYLEVSVSTPFLRRCFPNTYTVHYCNQGTTEALGAYVELTLDPDLTYQGASLPLAQQVGQQLTFDLGNIPSNDCGTFTVDVLLGCDSVRLGQSHCVAAHIFPDSICSPPDPGWSGASIELDAQCTGDSSIFFIQNIGTGNTAAGLQYIVIEDDVILFQGDFNLIVGELTRLAIPSTGATYRLEVHQAPGHPGHDRPSITVEGCTADGAASLGDVTRFPQNDADPFVDIDCQENRGSYDPNDKTGYPRGFSDFAYLYANQDLEYLIRFQNTGTDTAFRVVIRDTLSPLLDPTTLRMGAASHPYQYRLLGEGVLEVVFDPIQLPDSTTNAPGSIGFVRFRIAQWPDLGLGAQIYNHAGIYFDFNEVILTNRTLHTIGELAPTLVSFGTVENVVEVQFQLRPHPLREWATLDIQTPQAIEAGQIDVYNSLGMLVRRQRFSGPQVRLDRGVLTSGWYTFRVTEAGRWIGSGRLLVQ